MFDADLLKYRIPRKGQRLSERLYRLPNRSFGPQTLTARSMPELVERTDVKIIELKNSDLSTGQSHVE